MEIPFILKPVSSIPKLPEDDLSLLSAPKQGLFASVSRKLMNAGPEIITPRMSKVVPVTKQPERIFVVGDIHGCSKELEKLLDYLFKQCNFAPSDLLVFVGDYVDRGEDSKGVIDLILQLQKQFPGQIMCLQGNHEGYLLRALNRTHQYDGFDRWFSSKDGGKATCESYSTNPQANFHSELYKYIPEDHIEFLKNLGNLLISDDFAISHAGCTNEQALCFQTQKDLTSGGSSYQTSIHPSNKWVVFGHQALHEVVVAKKSKRIGVDTGCVDGRALSCLELRSQTVIDVQRQTLQVSEHRPKIRD